MAVIIRFPSQSRLWLLGYVREIQSHPMNKGLDLMSEARTLSEAQMFDYISEQADVLPPKARDGIRDRLAADIAAIFEQGKIVATNLAGACAFLFMIGGITAGIEVARMFANV